MRIEILSLISAVMVVRPQNDALIRKAAAANTI